jgi:cytidine deaminase
MAQIELAKMAKEASTQSYSPYSRAKVGSALETASGKFFYGCNVENSSFGGTVCAERVAIWKAVSEGEKSLKTIYVYTKDGWPPCGMCLQVMAEFATPDLKIIIGNAKGEEKNFTLKQLLPQAFTPENLKQL